MNPIESDSPFRIALAMIMVSVCGRLATRSAWIVERRSRRIGRVPAARIA